MKYTRCVSVVKAPIIKTKMNTTICSNLRVEVTTSFCPCQTESLLAIFSESDDLSDADEPVSGDMDQDWDKVSQIEMVERFKDIVPVMIYLPPQSDLYD